MVTNVSLNQIRNTLTTHQSSSLEASTVSGRDAKGEQTSSSDTISLRSESP